MDKSNPYLLYEDTKKLPEIFSQDDIQLILYTIETSKHYFKYELGEWMRKRDETIVMTIYSLALRPNETCSLRFDDFNSESMTVKIRGENNKTKKDRVLPIPMSLMLYFKEFFSFPRERFWHGSPFLFPSLQSNHISSGRWRHIFRQILKEAKLWKPANDSRIPPYRSYTLRHTKATELLNKSKDIFLVANVLGHGNLESTKTYLHKSEEYMEYMRQEIQ